MGLSRRLLGSKPDSENSCQSEHMLTLTLQKSWPTVFYFFKCVFAKLINLGYFVLVQHCKEKIKREIPKPLSNGKEMSPVVRSYKEMLIQDKK